MTRPQDATFQLANDQSVGFQFAVNQDKVTGTMARLRAIVKNGVLRPLSPRALPEGSIVEFDVQPPESGDEPLAASFRVLVDSNTFVRPESALARGFHHRIHPYNFPLLRTLPRHHPAVLTLQLHAEARDQCVGREIQWPGREAEAIEFTWDSKHAEKTMQFSSFAYEFISFDLFQSEWIEMAPETTEEEYGYLETATQIEALMAECIEAAQADGNLQIVEMGRKATEFAAALREAVRLRQEMIAAEFWKE